jgi:hypothetical protein
MDWKEWDGKKIFVQLKSGAVYSGIVKEVADVGDGTIFITIKDKFNMLVTFVANEIIKIVEEK